MTPPRFFRWACCSLLWLTFTTGLLAADGGPLPTTEPTTYSAPITISKGGTYTGNWKSTSDSTPAVYITTTQPVVILNSHLSSTGVLLSAPTQVLNLTVRNTSFHGQKPNTSTHFRGNAINASGYKSLVVENNYFENTGIVVATDEYSGDGTDNNTLRVRYNQVRNISGLSTSGAKRIVQFVAAQNYRQPIGNPKNAEIAWNDVINTPGASYSEDLINFFKAGGRVDGWFKVHDNYLQGSYPANPATDSSSGSAIIIDGPDNDKAAYVEAYNNFAINTTNAGMNVAAGSNIWYHHNRIISTGKLPNGTWMAGSFGGVGIFNYYAGSSEYVGTMHDIVVENNVVGWAKQGYTNPYTNRNDKAADLNGAYKSTNVSLPDAPITQAMQDAEYQTFLQRVQAAGVYLGPRAVAPNTAPTVSAIADFTINQNTGTGTIAFTVSDTDTAASALVATASSSNTTLVPNANLALGGSGANRTLTVTPASNQRGAAVITVSVSDGSLTTSVTFTLTVNAPPTLSTPANQTIAANTSTGAIAFTVGDVETAPGSLAVTRGSSNTTLLPVANVVLGGSGANRTVTLTPAAGQSGSSVVMLTVSDGYAAVSTTFTLTVADPSVVFVSDLAWTGTPQNGWGPPEKDLSNGEQNAGDGRPLKLRGTTYPKGLGVHAYSELVYSLNGNYSAFHSDIGVDDETNGAGSVVFQVWADGVKLYDSGTLIGTSTVQSADVSLTGKSQLKLIVTDAGDNTSSDHGDWAGARLTFTAFARWRQNYFTATALNDPAISGSTADPNGNGIPNLAEYFFGLDPLSTTTYGSLPTSDVAAGTLTLTYRKNTLATDVTGIVEQSADLINWSSSGVTDSLVTDGAVQIRRASVPMDGGRKFLRIKVTN